MKKTLVLILVILIISTVKAQESKLIGNWQLIKVEVNGEIETGLKAVFIFDDTGTLKAARNSDSKTISVGTWKYNKQKKLLEMSSDLDKDFNGEAIVVKVNAKELVYIKDEATLSFIKLEKMNSPAKIEMEKPILSFNIEEMYDEEGNFNYEEAEAKLPWTIKTIVNNLKNYAEIMYNVTSFPDEQDPEAWVESEKINYKEAEQSIDVRRFSYTQNDYIDMIENPIWMNNIVEYEYDFNFFPEENLDPYQVVGTENLETPAGNFECTVVIGYDRFSSQVKYWMINNKPGVFAKVINVKDAPTPFGSTNIYILKEIK